MGTGGSHVTPMMLEERIDVFRLVGVLVGALEIRELFNHIVKRYTQKQ